MIAVQGLRKHFGATRAVRDVSFCAKNGSITGLLGANGAGESTTLRIICGLLQPDAGTIRMESSNSHRLGALLDHGGLYSRLTARENLAYFAELHGLPRAQANKRADELLTLLCLQSEAHRCVAGFSVGQRAKLAIGRAIVHAPSNLLLDEPTNGLDVPAIRSLRALLRQFRDASCCMVFSSHVLDEVEQLCDHVVILARGSVVASGSSAELTHQTGGHSLEDAFVQLADATEETHA